MKKLEQLESASIFFPLPPCPNGNWHFLSNAPVIDSIMYEKKHSIFIFVILCGIESWFYYLVFAIMYLISLSYLPFFPIRLEADRILKSCCLV